MLRCHLATIRNALAGVVIADGHGSLPVGNDEGAWVLRRIARYRRIGAVSLASNSGQAPVFVAALQ
jgi:hypothetical protein